MYGNLCALLMAGLRHCGDPLNRSTFLSFMLLMLTSPQAPGDLQLAVRGGGDGGGRVGGGQAGLAGEVPARGPGFKRGGAGALPCKQHIHHTYGGLVTP